MKKRGCFGFKHHGPVIIFCSSLFDGAEAPTSHPWIILILFGLLWTFIIYLIHGV
jgi:hypothetical protein